MQRPILRSRSKPRVMRRFTVESVIRRQASTALVEEDFNPYVMSLCRYFECVEGGYVLAVSGSGQVVEMLQD